MLPGSLMASTGTPRSCANLCIELVEQSALQQSATLGVRSGRRQELLDLAGKLLPRRFLRQDDVVAAVEPDEPRAGDRRGDEPSMVEWHDAVVAAVHDERGRAHLRQQIGNIDIIACVPDSDGVLRRGG